MGIRLGCIGCTRFQPSIRHCQIGLYRLALQKQCSFSASTTNCKRGFLDEWTEEEERTVAEQVNKGSNDHEISSLLGIRSCCAISNRRKVLDTKGLLTNFTPTKRFTPDEDSRLLEAKSQGLSWHSAEKLFPHRTSKALSLRHARLTATQSHLTKRRLQAFSAEEDALLLDLVKSSHKRSGWKDVVDRFPGRSSDSVRRRYGKLVVPAKRIKFITGGSNAWSDAELEELGRLLDEGVPPRNIAIRLGRSLASIEQQSRRQKASSGQTKLYSPWTREEKEQLAALCSEGASRTYTARALNRSHSSIDAMLNLMNIRSRRQQALKRWTTVDAQLTFGLYESGVPRKEIALRLGRSLIAVGHKLRRMEFETQQQSSPSKGS